MSFQNRRAPSLSRWKAIAIEEAEKLGVCPIRVLGRDRLPLITLARHRAMARLYETGRYSKSGISKTIGYDHTSVMWAIRNLSILEDRCKTLSPEAVRRSMQPARQPRPIAPARFTIPVLVPADAMRRLGN